MFLLFFSFSISLLSSSSDILSLFKVFHIERLYSSVLACFLFLFSFFFFVQFGTIRPKTISLFSITTCIFFGRIIWTNFLFTIQFFL